MCNCNNDTCPSCDPGIEAFYQEKVKEAKEMSAILNKTYGGDHPYENFLEPKDIWYEYCALKKAAKLEEEQDKIEADCIPKEIKSPNEW